MAERRPPSPAPLPALAPFQACREALRHVESRLSAVLVACEAAGAQQLGNLQRLPAAARFQPFSSEPLCPQADASPASEDRADDGQPLTAAGSRRNARGSRPGHPPTHAGDERSPAGRRARPIDLPGRIPAATAPAVGPAAGPVGRALVGPAQQDAVGKGAQDAAALIAALLYRHPAPRQPARLHGIGGAPAGMPGATPGTLSAGAGRTDSPPSVGPARATLAPGGRGEDHEAQTAAPAPSPASPPPFPHLQTPAARRMGPMHGAAPPVTAEAARARAAAPTGPARAQQSGTTALHTLVTPLFMRATLQPAAPAEAAARAAQPPVLRAASRLLAAVPARDGQGQAGKSATGAPVADAAWPAKQAAALGAASELADGLERLLREQALLRGVDLK